MKKGIGALQWTFVELVLTLVIVIVAVVLLQGAMSELNIMDKRYQALEIASIINMLQASPDETIQAQPSPLCVVIESDHIQIEDYAVDFIISPVEVEQGRFGCGENGKYIVREDKISIRNE